MLNFCYIFDLRMPQSFVLAKLNENKVYLLYPLFMCVNTVFVKVHMTVVCVYLVYICAIIRCVSVFLCGYNNMETCMFVEFCVNLSERLLVRLFTCLCLLFLFMCIMCVSAMSVFITYFLSICC